MYNSLPVSLTYHNLKSKILIFVCTGLPPKLCLCYPEHSIKQRRGKSIFEARVRDNLPKEETLNNGRVFIFS